ncbi:MAG: hypothetical protein QW399_00995, partial [Sulfolobales archaeon]
TVNVETVLRVNITKPISVPLSQVVKVPIKVNITYDLTLKDLGLEPLVDRLISILSDIRKRV